MSKSSDATALLEEATQECGTARKKADQHGAYVSAKAASQQACGQLEKLPEAQKKPIAKELEEIKAKIAAAVAKGEKDKQPADAMPLLAEADKLLAAAKTKADMQAGLNAPVPNVEYIKLLMKESGGTKVLDEMVAGMDESTSRNVLEAAIEARFSLEFSQQLSLEMTGGGTADKTAPDKSVKRIYELLLMVPETHAADNPKIKAIERQQEDRGGAVYYYSGKIGLNCGRAGATGSHDQGAQLCSPDYFPDGVDPDCQPPAEAKGKEIRYFDWATLHEVGHAVDDNKGFMSGRQTDPKYGAWDYHGADVTKPAAAAKNKFKYDLDYIKQKLLGGNPAAAAKPDDVEQQAWDDAKAAVDKWCTKVLSYGLWWDGAGTKEVEIDGRVYQHMGDRGELPPRLVSYDYSARKRGIHGYQFRAPAEWFAELYAAYYMGALKPEHPAVKEWLPSALG
jgi:hypothetical protein